MLIDTDVFSFCSRAISEPGGVLHAVPVTPQAHRISDLSSGFGTKLYVTIFLCMTLLGLLMNAGLRGQYENATERDVVFT